MTAHHCAGDADTQWCEVSALARMFSGHRWGLYRWPAAVVAFLVGIEVLQAVPALALIVGVAAFWLSLWLLPGPRVGAGFNEDAISARGWFARRDLPWAEVDVLKLGMVSGTFTQGGFLGAEAVRGHRAYRLQRWFGTPQARARALDPLIDAASRHEVPVVVSRSVEYGFPGCSPDAVGTVRWVDGQPRVEPQAQTITARSAGFWLGAVAAIATAGLSALILGAATGTEMVAVFGFTFGLVAAGVLVEVVPMWRWARDRETNGSQRPPNSQR